MVGPPSRWIPAPCSKSFSSRRSRSTYRAYVSTKEGEEHCRWCAGLGWRSGLGGRVADWLLLVVLAGAGACGRPQSFEKEEVAMPPLLAADKPLCGENADHFRYAGAQKACLSVGRGSVDGANISFMNDKYEDTDPGYAYFKDYTKRCGGEGYQSVCLKNHESLAEMGAFWHGVGNSRCQRPHSFHGISENQCTLDCIC